MSFSLALVRFFDSFSHNILMNKLIGLDSEVVRELPELPGLWSSAWSPARDGSLMVYPRGHYSVQFINELYDGTEQTLSQLLGDKLVIHLTVVLQL